MVRIAGGVVAGVVVGAAALAGLSLAGLPRPAPEEIAVVEEVPAEAPADAGADGAVGTVEARRAVPVAESGTEVVGAPRTLVAEAETARQPPDVTEDAIVSAPVAATPMAPDPVPALDLAETEPTPIMPEALAGAVRDPSGADSAEPPLSLERGTSAATPEAAPEMVAAEPLTPEQVLGIVAPEEAAPAGEAGLVQVGDTEPDGPKEIEAPEAAPAASALPGRIRVGGSALPGRDAVRVNRPGAEASEAPEPEVAAKPETVVPEDTPALRRYATAWEPPAEAKPRLAVVLLDDGATDPQAVAALPWPVSVALDPTTEGAAERLAAYRAAGVEAVMLARLPEGAQPTDAAAILGDAMAQLPETVAVLDLGDGGLEGRNATAQMAMSVVAREGRGVVLGDDKLGAGLALAGREGVPAAEVLRDLDGAGQDDAAIRRGLDDAARRAGQEGRGIVLGRVKAETLAALVEWSGEARAAEVAMAPVSGVLVAR